MYFIHIFSTYLCCIWSLYGVYISCRFLIMNCFAKLKGNYWFWFLASSRVMNRFWKFKLGKSALACKLNILSTVDKCQDLPIYVTDNFLYDFNNYLCTIFFTLMECGSATPYFCIMQHWKSILHIEHYFSSILLMYIPNTQLPTSWCIAWSLST